MYRFLPIITFTFQCLAKVTADPIVHTAPFGEWILYDTSNSQLPENFLTSAAVDSSGRIWSGSWSKGVAMFDGLEWRVDNTGNSSIPNDTIQDIAVDRQNNIWIGTNNGIAGFNGTIWQAYTQDNAPFPVRYSSAIACDANNIVWFASGNVDTGGLMRFDGINWYLYTSTNSLLPCKAINTIAVDKNNTVWVGTTQFQGNGGLVSIQGDTWSVYDKSNSVMPYNCVDVLCADTRGNIWVGMNVPFYNTDTLDGALTKTDITGNNWTMYNPSESGNSSNRITSIVIDTNGYIWAATSIDMAEDSLYYIFYDYAISVCNGEKWIALTEIDTLLRRTYCSDGVADKQNNVWFATDRGLLKITPNNLESLFNVKIKIKPPMTVHKKILDFETGPIRAYDLRGRCVGFSEKVTISKKYRPGVYIMQSASPQKRLVKFCVVR